MFPKFNTKNFSIRSVFYENLDRNGHKSKFESNKSKIFFRRKIIKNDSTASISVFKGVMFRKSVY